MRLKFSDLFDGLRYSARCEALRLAWEKECGERAKNGWPMPPYPGELVTEIPF